jgi:hypothetical protein
MGDDRPSATIYLWPICHPSMHAAGWVMIAHLRRSITDPLPLMGGDIPSPDKYSWNKHPIVSKIIIP